MKKFKFSTKKNNYNIKAINFDKAFAMAKDLCAKKSDNLRELHPDSKGYYFSDYNKPVISNF